MRLRRGFLRRHCSGAPFRDAGSPREEPAEGTADLRQFRRGSCGELKATRNRIHSLTLVATSCSHEGERVDIANACSPQTRLTIVHRVAYSAAEVARPA